MAFFLRFFVFLVLAACSLTTLARANEPVILPTHPDPLEIVSMNGDVIASFDVEIAATFDQRATGLMHRKDFGGDAAMLFDFKLSRRIAMWMKNTPSSLDMLFVGGDRKILAIETNTTPFSLAVISPDVNSSYVVEIGAGEAEKRGIKVGQGLRHSSLKGNVE